MFGPTQRKKFYASRDYPDPQKQDTTQRYRFEEMNLDRKRVIEEDDNMDWTPDFDPSTMEWEATGQLSPEPTKKILTDQISKTSGDSQI